MTIWAISLEGNAATRRQVAMAAKALQAASSDAGNVVFLTARVPTGSKTLDNNTIVTWTEIPTEAQLETVETVEGARLTAPWPHTVIACRPEVAALALAIKAASKGATRIVQVQDPNDVTGTYVFDRAGFDLIIKQPHEAVSGPNVVVSMPLHNLTPESLAQHRAQALKASPQYRDVPPLVVLLGGSDEHVTLAPDAFADFGSDISALETASDILVLSSRRTSAAQLAAFSAATAHDPRLTINLHGLSYDQALGLGGQFVVDGTSASMIAEVLATGMPLSVYDYRGKLQNHPLWQHGDMHAGLCRFPTFSKQQDNDCSDN